MSTIDETSNKKPVQQHPTDATPLKDEIHDENVSENEGEDLLVKNKPDVSENEKKPEEPINRTKKKQE